MLHPAVAHFAVSLPIISLVLGLMYLMKPSEVMSKISSRFLIFTAIFIVIAYFSGEEDAEEVFDFLSSDAKALLGQHAKLGLYLAISMPVVALIRFYACKTSKFKIELFSIVLLAVLSAATVYQGKMGGELTFDFGVNVKGFTEGQACIAEAKAMDDDEDE
ncbi:MAG: hypothetical protein COB17_03940 [Sulfurimonas sp.]|nr:MAG: hypothetical protein COB17_03940 [Sulfurimonas sp.]